MLKLDFHLALYRDAIKFRAILPIIFTCASLSLGSSRTYQLLRTYIHVHLFTLAFVSLHRASLRTRMSQC